MQLSVSHKSRRCRPEQKSVVTAIETARFSLVSSVSHQHALTSCGPLAFGRAPRCRRHIVL
uniref:Uncharacterized protein n=1 Tax=Anopheles minimus TaxID=112268 RepID=A0A182VX09_9DIPT